MSAETDALTAATAALTAQVQITVSEIAALKAGQDPAPIVAATAAVNAATSALAGLPPAA